MSSENKLSVRREGRVLRFVFAYETKVYDFKVVQFENYAIGDTLWHFGPAGSAGVVTSIESIEFSADPTPDMTLDELTSLMKGEDASPADEPPFVRDFVYGVPPMGYSSLRTAMPLGPGTYGYIAFTGSGGQRGSFMIATPN